MRGWSRSHPRARKPHQCILCHRTIGIGETHLRGAGFDGHAWSWRECANCEAFMELVQHLHGLDEYSDADLDNFEPDTLGQLRVKILWQRRWRRADGTLHPIPEVVYGEPVRAYVGSELVHEYRSPIDIRIPKETAHAA